jgi:hypothetical protein
MRVGALAAKLVLRGEAGILTTGRIASVHVAGYAVDFGRFRRDDKRRLIDRVEQ